MKKGLPYDVLYPLLQDGQINHLQFLCNCEDYSYDYLKWCKEHDIAPDNTNAEFYYDMTCLTAEENQAFGDSPFIYEL